MCTVLLRFAPGSRWPVVLGAIRDEFAARAWDPPERHWPGAPHLWGGRDRLAGGTWLAVDPSPERPAVAALLNGIRRPPPPDDAPRPTRGSLVIDALAGTSLPDPASVADFDGFHLLLATPEAVRVWSWDAEHLVVHDLTPGDHILVNLGVDTPDDPLVPHFEPLLAAVPAPLLPAGAPPLEAWSPWTDLLAGDGLDPADPRALLVHREIEDRTYASTSASLVALGADHARYAFNPIPTDLHTWYEVDLSDGSEGS